jgi:hypothetical protein
VNLQPRIPVRIGGFLFPAVRVSPDGLSVTGHRSATRALRFTGVAADSAHELLQSHVGLST